MAQRLTNLTSIQEVAGLIPGLAQCRSQTQLGSCVAVAVVQAGSCSSDQTPGLGTPYAVGAALKRQKTKTKTKNPKFDC